MRNGRFFRPVHSVAGGGWLKVSATNSFDTIKPSGLRSPFPLVMRSWMLITFSVKACSASLLLLLVKHMDRSRAVIDQRVHMRSASGHRFSSFCLLLKCLFPLLWCEQWWTDQWKWSKMKMKKNLIIFSPLFSSQVTGIYMQIHYWAFKHTVIADTLYYKISNYTGEGKNFLIFSIGSNFGPFLLVLFIMPFWNKVWGSSHFQNIYNYMVNYTYWYMVLFSESNSCRKNLCGHMGIYMWDKKNKLNWEFKKVKYWHTYERGQLKSMFLPSVKFTFGKWMVLWGPQWYLSTSLVVVLFSEVHTALFYISFKKCSIYVTMYICKCLFPHALFFTPLHFPLVTVWTIHTE